MPSSRVLCRSCVRSIRAFPRPIAVLVAGLLGIAVAGGPAPAAAVAVVDPGEGVVLTSVDGGSITCRRGTSDGGSTFFDCLLSGTAGTRADPAGNFLRARSHVSLGSLRNADGIPNYATARLYKDIEVQGGPPDTYVPVEISALFDYKSLFLLGAAYSAHSNVTLNVVDLETNTPVASTTLFATSRDGSQGFTDVALADQRQVIPGASGNLHVLLQRGRSYRLVFELEVMSQVLAVGAVEADSSATLTSLTVRVDEDEVQQLADHDDAVRSQLATHDADVKALLAQLLAGQQQLEANQREIIRLLLTPQGQRASDVIGGQWPLLAPPGQTQAGGADVGTASPAQQTTPRRRSVRLAP